jgi:hypothetical protein
MLTPPAPSPLGRPSQAEVATVQAEIHIVLLPAEEVYPDTENEISLTDQPGRLAQTLGHLALAAIVIGALIRWRVSSRR